MKRSAPIRRSRLRPAAKPIRKRNPKRAARLFAEDFGGKEYRDHIAALPCAWCHLPGPCDPHHVRSRGAGGKASDLVPLCFGCHGEIHRKGYSVGQRAYLATKAADLWSRWLAARKAEGTQE